MKIQKDQKNAPIDFLHYTKIFWTPYPTRMSVKKCTKAKLKCLKPKPKISYFLWPLMFSGIDIAIFPPNNCRLSDICNNLQ